MLKKIKSWILPKEIDFFESLRQQSLMTTKIIDELADFYLTNPSKDSKKIFDLIDEEKIIRKSNLIELNSTFITPVDKEAISRAYVHLHWIVLSTKHLVVEINIYKIFELKNYYRIFELLQQEMQALSAGFRLLNNKQFDKILEFVHQVINLDDLLIKEYAELLIRLFKEENMGKVLEHKEILSQMREISKQIHICSNQLEDIVFKMN